IFGALAEQTTVVAGTSAAEHIVGRLAAQLQQLTQQRADIETEILTVVDAHPLTEVLTSMPGTGVRTAARILTEVVGKDFHTRSPPGLICRHRTRDPPIRNLHPWRIPVPAWQQSPQACAVLVRFRFDQR